MKKTRRQRVAEAVQDIRDFHKLGCQSLRQRPARGDYAGRAIETEAERIGMSSDTLRKARQFADPEAGYSAAERDELCELCLTIQTDLDEADAIFGRTHVLLMITVPKGDRHALQHKAIEHGWSTNRLQLEIKKLHGTRKSGGRKPRVARDREEALAQLEGLCERWRRWTAEFMRLRRIKGKSTKGLRNIPRKLVAEIQSAAENLGRLQASVTRELQRALPERSARK